MMRDTERFEKTSMNFIDFFNYIEPLYLRRVSLLPATPGNAFPSLTKTSIMWFSFIENGSPEEKTKITVEVAAEAGYQDTVSLLLYTTV